MYGGFVETRISNIIDNWAAFQTEMLRQASMLSDDALHIDEFVEHANYIKLADVPKYYFEVIDILKKAAVMGQDVVHVIGDYVLTPYECGNGCTGLMPESNIALSEALLNACGGEIKRLW